MKVTIISARYGDKTQMMEKQEVIELAKKLPNHSLIQNNKVIKTHELVDNADATFLPMIAGG